MKSGQSVETFLNNDSIRKILLHFLDKADSKALSERTRKLSVPIDEKNFPELYYPKSYSEDKLLAEAILGLCDYGIFELKCPSRKKYLPLIKRNAKLYFNSDFEEQIREFYGRPIKEDEWKNAIENHSFRSTKAQEILSSRPIAIKNKSAQEIIANFDAWATQDSHAGTVRQESAKCFWGMSKLFDGRDDIIQAFGLRETPVMLNVYAFSDQIKSLLFVENLDTYNEVISSTNPIFSNMVVIFASGYKTSAKRLRDRSGSRMFFEENCKFSKNAKERFIEWFYRKEEHDIDTFFWGDLDYSGIGILITLKENFPDISAWEIGYAQMLQAQKDGNGHEPEMANKENQSQPSINTLSPVDYCNSLLASMKTFNTFVDQEIVDIKKL